MQDDARFAISYMRMVAALSVFALTGRNPLDQLHELVAYTVRNGVRAVPSRIDPERLRFHWEKDPLLFARGRIQITVYYRITDEGPDAIQHEDTPWPDVYCGEFFLIVEKTREHYGIKAITLQDVEEFEMPVPNNRWRITNHAEFADSWEEAQAKMRHQVLELPGTNVPREEATEAIFETLRMNLPSKQLF